MFKNSRRPQDWLVFERDQPFYQIVLPKTRLDIFHNRKNLIKEHEREFPDSIESVKTFFSLLNQFDSDSENQQTDSLQKFKRILPKISYLDRKKIKINEVFSQLNLPKAFQKSIIAQCSLISNTHNENPTMVQAANILSPCNRKDYFFHGKSRDLAQIFYDRIIEAGGSVRDDATVESLIASKGKITGARLSSYEGVIHAKHYIGNLDIHHLYGLFNPKNIPINSKRKLEKHKPEFAQSSFYLGVEKEVIPIKMGNHLVLICDENRSLSEDNLIFIHTMNSEKNLSHCTLQISFFLPYPNETKKDAIKFQQDIKNVQMKVLEHINWLIPFLKPNILFSLPNGNGSKKSEVSFIHKFPLYRCIYNFHKKDKISSNLFRNKTNFSNLFYTGPEIYPFLGFEGETLSSIKTAELILKATSGSTR